MDRKKRKREVYKHTASAEVPIASNASKRRIHVEHPPPPPRSPEKQRDYDHFDALMGFADDGAGGPITIEGPAALKIKVKQKAKRYENSVSVFYFIQCFLDEILIAYRTILSKHGSLSARIIWTVYSN
jgi:hypothetical protein